MRSSVLLPKKPAPIRVRAVSFSIPSVPQAVSFRDRCQPLFGFRKLSFARKSFAVPCCWSDLACLLTNKQPRFQGAFWLV